MEWTSKDQANGENKTCAICSSSNSKSKWIDGKCPSCGQVPLEYCPNCGTTIEWTVISDGRCPKCL